MADDKVIIELELDDGSIKKGFAVLKKEGQDAGKSVGKSLEEGISKSLNGIASGAGSVLGGLFNLKTAILGIGASLAAAVGGKAVIDAAAESDDAINRLNTALALTGISSEDTRKRFKGLAEEIQRTTRFGDDMVMENIGLLQSLSNLDANGLDRATRAAIDLSSALNIDLGSAVTLVGKAANGEVGAFSRYGLAIQKGKTDAETFANTLATLESRFSGSAQAQVKTYSGAVAQLGNNFGDFTEKLGEVITRNPVVIKTISIISDTFTKLGDFIKDNQQAITDLITNGILKLSQTMADILAPTMFTVLAVVIDSIIAYQKFDLAVREFDLSLNKVIRTGINFFNVFGLLDGVKEKFEKIGTEVSGNIDGIKSSISGLSSQKDKAESFFIGIDEKIKAANTSIQEFAKSNNKLNSDVAMANQPKPAKALFDTTKQEEFLKKTLEQTNAANMAKLDSQLQNASSEEAIQAAFEAKRFALRQEGDARIQVLEDQAALLGLSKAEEVSAAKIAIEQQTEQRLFELAKSQGERMNEITKASRTALVGGLVSSFSALGGALARAQNGFQAFTSAVIGAIGNLAIQIGTMLVGVGLGFSAAGAIMPAWAAAGIQTTAAGLALITLGGAISAMGSGGGSAGVASPSAGSGSSGSGSTGSAPTDFTETATTQERSAAVTVNIEGNVFDSKETGLRIADILNEHFDTSNGILAT
jgi:hypothetical protein